MEAPLVGVIMGSRSDWETMKHSVDTLEGLGIPVETLALSAHRTPHEVAEWASQAESRGVEVIIAAAGGAAHLAGVVAAHTVLPVLGVPMKAWSLDVLPVLWRQDYEVNIIRCLRHMSIAVILLLWSMRNAKSQPQKDMQYKCWKMDIRNQVHKR